jgi:beta-glucosidase
MRTKLLLTISSLTLLGGFAHAGPDEQGIDALLKQMSFDEKISMLSGDSTGFNAPGIERLGIPTIYMSDGPVGVRSGKSTAYPVTIGLSASWDADLAREYGRTLAEETLAKGKNCILGPCVCVSRFPLSGRNFESFGEDPVLSGMLASAVVKGVQEKGVLATIKHFAANDQEWRRNDVDSIVSERALHEVHLLPFEYGVKDGGVWAVMSSYNLVNGEHASENRHLLSTVLKEDWGFRGLVMSDWVSVYSADKAANAGLDLEMPNAVWFGEKLAAAVKDGRVTQATIDDKILRSLRARSALGMFDRPAPVANQALIETQAHRDMARRMAEESITLLKNNGLLPLDKAKAPVIALIGPNSQVARTGGGGSSCVEPWRTTSPLEGLRALLGEKATILANEGIVTGSANVKTIPTEALRTPDGKPGLRGEYFNNQDYSGTPVVVRDDAVVDFQWGSQAPAPGIHENFVCVRWTGRFIAPVSGKINLGTRSDDGSRLYLDGKLIADNWGNHDMTAPVVGEVTVEAGKSYDIRIDYVEDGGDAGMALVWQDPTVMTGAPTIEGAVKAAEAADVVILCVGNSKDYEGEGRDLTGFDMPGAQEELIQSVLAAGKPTIVVLYGGTPLKIDDWAGKASAILNAYYPGQEGGDALAEILFGEVNPSGKLPYSYIQEASQSPGFTNYQNPDLRVPYVEDIFVGYKWYETHGVTPLYPFGYGLSYTSFAYSNLRVEASAGFKVRVSLDVTNTGKRAGKEVVQLYVGQNAPSVTKPVRELRNFAKVALEPGETKTVIMDLDSRAFRHWDESGHTWANDPGLYTIQVGASSSDLRLTGTAEAGAGE